MVRLSRISVLHLMLTLFAALLVAQAARVQLVHGQEWAEKARRQQFKNRAVSAARGNIFDAAGNLLVQSREVFKLNIAPNEVRNPAVVSAEMRKLGLDSELIRSALDNRRKWLTLPGTWVSSDIATLVSQAGIHADAMMTREYAAAPGIRQILGTLDAAGRPTGGIELALDTLLTGDSVVALVARDVHGKPLDSPESRESEPRAGSSVTLTINRDLQDICERALTRAVDSLDAAGGDIVVMNPNTGEVLAMASLRRGRKSYSVTAVTEPFEPGSTIKPFIAAALLERSRARVDEVIDTHNGQLVLDGRTVTDLHKRPSMPLSDVIRFSSNVGIIEFGMRLSPREKFETLRDLGFGMATGVPLPGESDGTLREPKRWSRQSAASLSMGYEISVTPLQLVAAYAALANGGVLLQPQIIREIRGPDGEMIFAGKRRVLRRVFSERVADEVRGLLRSVVDSGTAVKADLAAFEVAGKSGTARRTERGKGYVAGSYTASFVGLFPANKPQYVVLVKLDAPRRAFYGGEVAAPVTSVVLRAAVAARDAALDRAELASVERDVPLPAASAETTKAGERPDSPRSAAIESDVEPVTSPFPAEPMQQPPAVFSLPYSPRRTVVDDSPRAVPDVRGLTLRGAVRALHRAGFRVRLATAQAELTVPEAGTVLPAGSIVKLQHIP